MFEKSLTSLIKGLRSHRGKDEAKYIAQMTEEIRSEIKSADMDIKAEAVLKLAYLHMLGYRISSASFHIVETMASSNYRIKFIGYLAASLCFSEDTEVLILATNLIKKDLHAASPLDALAALNGLSHIITQELARHLADDVIMMLTHTRALVRKRAVLVLYQVILQCPEVLDRTYERIRDLLCDNDQSVVTATVNVLCELARRNPAPFVPLSPQLFEILTSSSNNWLLIKVIKLFGALTPVEPRLVRKLVKPVSSIISTTPAMSLLYECIHTAIIGGMLERPDSDELAYRCVENLGRFLQDSDQNLRYISLLALDKLTPSHPHLVAQHQQLILESMWHPDFTIRLRALELVVRLASDPLSLRPIVDFLVMYLSSSEDISSSPRAAQMLQKTLDADKAHVLEPSVSSHITFSALKKFHVQVAESILDVGCANKFRHVRDPSWYLNVLIRLAQMVDASIVSRISDQLTDFVFMHESVQAEACAMLLPLLLNENIYNRENPLSNLLRAGALITSEFVEHMQSIPDVVQSLLRDETHDLPSRTVAVLVHSALKIFAYWTAQLSQNWNQGAKKSLECVTEYLVHHLVTLSQKDDAEVYERCKEGLQLFVLLQNGIKGSDVQGKAPVPDSTQEWGDATIPESTAPRALHLLLPLFHVRSEILDPPAPLPSSMDLHAWIVSESSWKQMLDAVEPISKPPGSRSKMLEGHTSIQKASTSASTLLPDASSTFARASSMRSSSGPGHGSKALSARDHSDNPFYLTSKPRMKKSSRKKHSDIARPSEPKPEFDDLQDIPIVKLDLSDLTPQKNHDTPTPRTSSQVRPKVVSHKKSARRK